VCLHRGGPDPDRHALDVWRVPMSWLVHSLVVTEAAGLGVVFAEGRCRRVRSLEVVATVLTFCAAAALLGIVPSSLLDGVVFVVVLGVSAVSWMTWTSRAALRARGVGWAEAFLVALRSPGRLPDSPASTDER
jgi:hypothetical protein